MSDTFRNRVIDALKAQADKYQAEIDHLEAQRLGVEKAIAKAKAKHEATVEALNSLP